MNTKMRKIAMVVLLSVLMLTLLSVKTKAVTTEEVKDIVFDGKFYLTKYEDLRNAYGADETKAYEHYITFGIKEGRAGSQIFDISYYLTSNPDLKEAYGKNCELAYQHFLTFGYNEGRSGSELYNMKYYRANNPDVDKAYGTDNGGVYKHYALCGQKEGRLACEKFDVGCYVNSYNDLKRTFGKDWVAALRHYVVFGQYEKTRKALKHDYNVVDKPATCETAGEKSQVCKTCGRGTKTIIPALGHNFGKDAKEQAATCTQVGYRTFECTRCHKNIGEVIAPLGHQLSEWKYEDGKHYQECTREDNLKVNEDDCTYGDWGPIAAEDKTEENATMVESRACTVCGHKEFRDLKATAEDNGDKTIEFQAEDVTESFEVPANKTVEIKGKINATEPTTITVKSKGKLVLDETPGNNVSITRNLNATVEMVADTDADIRGALTTAAGYVTDLILEKDVTLDSKINVVAKTNQDIDLNGKTLSIKDDDTDSQIIYNDHDGVLNIFNGTITNVEDKKSALVNKANGTVYLTDVTFTGGKNVYNEGLLVVDGCDFTSKNCNIACLENGAIAQISNSKLHSTGSYCLATNGTFDTQTLTVDTVEITSDADVAVYLPAEGIYTFTDCTITGKGGIDALAGSVSVIGGSVTSTATEDDSDFEPDAGDGSVLSKYAVLLRSKRSYGDTDDTLTFAVSNNAKLTSAANTKAVKVHKSTAGAGVGTVEIKGVEENDVDCGIEQDVTVKVGEKTISQGN